LASTSAGCRVSEFLDRLEGDSPQDFDQVVAELNRVATDGPPMSPMKSRPLGGKVYEFKTRGGIRIPYFYDAGRLIVCTEAMRKPKKAEVAEVIGVNGCSMLYSSAREYLLLITGRAPWGQVRLPTMSFNGLSMPAASAGQG